MSVVWPLVGRQPEIELIGKDLAREELSGLVLAGPAGVGKTRLAAECLQFGERVGFAVARAAATRAAASVPLGAFAPLLVDVEEAAAASSNPLVAARTALVERAAGRPLLLLVDDAHLLDDASAALVHQLAGDPAVFVVATVRTGAQIPEPVVALWKDGYVHRIELRPLSREETDHLVVSVLGPPVDGGMLLDLWEASRGNPLYLRELVLGAIESGAIAKRGDVWRLAGPLGASARLATLVESRLADLADAERRTLELLAFGEPIGVSVLESMVGSGALEELERKGLLEVRPDGRRLGVWLAHPVHGEVLRAQLGVLRSRALQRTLADAVEGSGSLRREDTLRVATWRLEGGGATRPDVLLAGARQARLLGDLELRERLSRAAWETGQGGVTATHLLGYALCELGRHDEAESVLATVRLDDCANDEERMLLGRTRAENLFRLGKVEDAISACDDATAATSDTHFRNQLVAHRATFDLLTGDVTGALRRVEPLLDAEGSELVSAATAAGPALSASGRTQEAIALSHRALAAHRATKGELGFVEPGAHLVYRAYALIEEGHLDDATRIAREGYDAALTERSRVGQAWFAMLLAQIELERGSPAVARRWLLEAKPLFAGVGQPVQSRWCLAAMVRTAGVAGDSEAGAAALAELEKLGGPASLDTLDVARGRAALAAAGGDRAAARALLKAAVAGALERGQRAAASAALHELARLGDTGAAEQLADVARDLDGELAATRVAHARALAARDGVVLDDVSVRFEGMGMLQRAAEAAADAARMHQADGVPRKAAAAQLRSRALSDRCDGALLPEVELGLGITPLTDREREVAILAAQGLSSRAIAERLYVSVRTVDNHLQRTYEKLGIGGRSELAKALGSGPGSAGA